MIVDQDAHPPHHLPSRSRHGSGTACHDRQALVPPWAPLAHALAHSRGDGHQAQPEGLETIPSRSAQGWTLPREARSRLERSVEASIAHVSRAAGCHMAVSALAATARDQTSGGGAKYGKADLRCLFSDVSTKNRWSQPSFCTVGGSGPNLLCLTSHPCMSMCEVRCGGACRGRLCRLCENYKTVGLPVQYNITVSQARVSL